MYSYSIIAALLILSVGFTSAFADDTLVNPNNLSFGQVSPSLLPYSGPEVIDVNTGEQVVYDKSKHYVLYNTNQESLLESQEKQLVSFNGNQFYLVPDPLDRTANMIAVLLLGVPFGLLVYRMSDSDPIPVKYAKLSAVSVAVAMFSMFTTPISFGNNLWGYAY